MVLDFKTTLVRKRKYFLRDWNSVHIQCNNKLNYFLELYNLLLMASHLPLLPVYF